MTFQAKTSTQTFLPGKTLGFPREFTGTPGIYWEVYRDSPGSSPGCTGKFPGIWLSLLWIHWEIPGSAGELTEKARDLPGYRDAPRYFTGESPVNFQFPGKSLYLFLHGTSNLTSNYLDCEKSTFS